MPDRKVMWASTAGPNPIHDYRRGVEETPLWSQWNVTFVATHREGSQARKIAVFIGSIGLFAAQLLRRRPTVAHLHGVLKLGSLSRNVLLAWMSRLAGVPVILHLHPMNPDSPSRLKSMLLRAVSPDVTLTTAVDAAELDEVYRSVRPRRGRSARR